MFARIQILVAAVMFGTTGTSQALAAVDAPVAVGTMRIIIGGALLVLLAVATRALRGLTKRPGTLLLAGVGVAAYQLAFFAAVARTGVVVGTIVAIGVGPVATGAFEWLIARTRQSVRWAIATSLAGAGVAILTTASGAGGGVEPVGVLLALVAGAGYALYAVLAKNLLTAGCEPAGVMAGAFGVGAMILVPALFVVDLGWLAQPSGWALAIYLGVVPTVVAYLLYAHGLRRMRAAEAATLTLAEPATATLLGALVLGEQLGAGSIVGIGLVTAAMVVLSLPTRPAPLAQPAT